MAKFLSQAWHDEARRLAQTFPEKPGATAKLGYHVTGGPDGDVHYYLVIENGRVIEQANGQRDDLDVTLVSSFEDSVKMQKGELDANAAFMQGKVKIAAGGNMGKMMALMPLTMSPDYKAIQEKLREITEY